METLLKLFSSRHLRLLILSTNAPQTIPLVELVCRKKSAAWCGMHAQLLEKLLLSSSFWKVWSVEQNTFKTNVKELKKHEIHTRPPSTSLRWGSQGCCSRRVCWGEGCFTLDTLPVHHRATQTDKQHSNSHLFNNLELWPKKTHYFHRQQ